MPPMVAVSKIASRCVLPCSRVSRRARSWRLRPPATPASAAATTIAGALVAAPARPRLGWDRRAARHGQVELGRRGGRGVEHDLGRAGGVGDRIGALAPGHHVAVDEQADAGADVLDVCGHAHPRAGRLR